MWKRKRHKYLINLLRPIFKAIFKTRYNCSFDTPVSFPEGALFISNHVTTMDPFMIGMLSKEHVYYMANTDLFDHFITGKLIEFLVKPIPKQKGKKSDLAAIKNCCRVAKEGSSICIFVEGNRSFSGELCYFDESIAKLVMLLKKPVVLCNIQGGYGTDPRFSKGLRKGKMHVGINKIYSVEEIKNMSMEEIYMAIKEGINVDNFNYYHQYKSRNRAMYLERVFYKCPICSSMHTLYSKGNSIICKCCGNEVNYNEDLTLSSSNPKFQFKYVKDWYNYQIDEIKKMDIEDDALIYSEKVILTQPRKYKTKKVLGKGILKFYGNKLVFDLNKNSLEFKFQDIEDMSILGKKKMNFYIDGQTYQFFGDKRINMIKYLTMFYFIRNRKEGNEDGFMGL
jgi:1-acyl-sn-glycerol-3-phosphate acyltransferase